MSESPATPPQDQEAGKRRGPSYRSIADGELLHTWSLKDYFASLNTVLRLPTKPKPKPEAEEEIKPALSLPSLPNIRLPKMVVASSVVLSVGVLIVRPILLSASRADAASLAAAVGVWEAEGGRYAGRMFELGTTSIAFRTSAKSPDYTWHRIADLEVEPARDSTLYTLHYEQDGKLAEFGFWLITGKNPVIRVTHQAGTNWNKTPYEPIAKPR